MAILKAFKGIRPDKELVKRVACRPYDVLDEKEARIEANGDPISFYHVIKPEIDSCLRPPPPRPADSTST